MSAPPPQNDPGPKDPKPVFTHLPHLASQIWMSTHFPCRKRSDENRYRAI